MTLDDDDKKWVRDEIGGVRTELRKEIQDLRAEMRGGFEGMKEAFVTMAASNAAAMDSMSREVAAMSRNMTTAIDTPVRYFGDVIATAAPAVR